MLLTDEEFFNIRNYIKELSGIHLADSKKQLVINRLYSRIIALKLPNFEEYFKFLKSTEGKEEVEEFINRITTNKTDFFREKHHFDFISTKINKEIIEKIERFGSFRILSAACSTGEEPYTIAMTLTSFLNEQHIKKVFIEGVDINTQVIIKAKVGIYPIQEVVGLSNETKKEYFLKGDNRVKIKDHIKNLVQFKSGNLMDEKTYQGKQYDIIFCRNMMIYLQPETQTKLINIFNNFLKPSGYFFTGHAENIQFLTDQFQMIQPSIYKKKFFDK